MSNGSTENGSSPRLTARMAAEYPFATPARQGEIVRNTLKPPRGHGFSHMQVEQRLRTCYADGVLDPAALAELRAKLKALEGSGSRFALQARLLDVVEQTIRGIELPSVLGFAPYTRGRLMLHSSPFVAVTAHPHALIVDTSTQVVRGALYIRFTSSDPLSLDAGRLGAHLVREAAAETFGWSLERSHTYLLDVGSQTLFTAPAGTKLLTRKFQDGMLAFTGSLAARKALRTQRGD